MSRLRGGSAGAARGAASFLTETVNRVRDAGSTRQLTVRADSAFYSKAVFATAVKFQDLGISAHRITAVENVSEFVENLTTFAAGRTADALSASEPNERYLLAGSSQDSASKIVKLETSGREVRAYLEDPVSPRFAGTIPGGDGRDESTAQGTRAADPRRVHRVQQAGLRRGRSPRSPSS